MKHEPRRIKEFFVSDHRSKHHPRIGFSDSGADGGTKPNSGGRHEGIEEETMSGDNQPETVSVPVTQQDFMVIRASLHHSISFWGHVLETKEYPENFDEGKAREILTMSQDVMEKVNMILTMKPIPSPNVGVSH